MSYCTLAGFTAAFPGEVVALTNLDDPAATTTDETELQQALDAATAEIDLYLARRYTLPLSTVPEVLVQFCVDIARYRLDRNQPDEDVRQRYEDAIRALERIGDGKVDLPIPEPTQSAGMPSYTSPTRVWGSTELSGW